MKDAKDLVQDEFYNFSRKNPLSNNTPFFIYNEAFLRGFEIASSQEKVFTYEHSRIDLKGKVWLFKPTDSNNLYEMANDLEVCKKYLRILMEWKDASNP